MANYEFKIDNRNFEKRMNEYNKLVPNAAERGMKLLAASIIRSVKVLTPWKTGNLRKNWNMSQQGNDIVIYNNVEYAYYVEYGHRKRGKSKKTILRQMSRAVKTSKATKRTVKTSKEQFVPGRFMLRRAFDSIDKKAAQIIEREIRKITG
ncbi:MAG: putative tail-component [Bacteriophage sp.]|nr:MAG: putative tail-component [Bacteriophage sp.]UWG92255.1 MAG: putative tail-component [Bacteriophage sp.]